MVNRKTLRAGHRHGGRAQRTQRGAGRLAALRRRVVHYNRVGFSAPSFNSDLVFRASERDTIRLMLAHGVQLPSLIDFSLQLPFSETAPVLLTGNPALRPAVVDNIGLDYDRAVQAIDGTMHAAI